MVLDFNQGWKFYRGSLESITFDDSNWETVCLPHSVRLEPVMASSMVNYQGDAYYQKHFVIDNKFIGKHIYIKFEAAMHKACVTINGAFLTTHFGGYLPFTVDITEYVKFGEENLICVKVNNEDDPLIPPGKPQCELDFCYFGGLYRDVHMIIKNDIHITEPIFANKVADGGIFVRFENNDILVKVHLINYKSPKKIQAVFYIDNQVFLSDEVEIFDNITIEKTIKLENPKLWSPKSPNLYDLKIEIIGDNEILDTESLKVGIKDIKFTKEACYINGEKTLLTGVNRHQEYPYIGNAMTDKLHYRDAQLLKEAGYNIVRTGHYPSDEAFLNACDELGLLIITPTPGWQFYPDKNCDVFDERSIQNVREMVRHTRNHACVGFWEPILNEEGRSPDSYRRSTYQAVHEEYPNNQCYCAIDEEYDSEKIYDIIYKKTLEHSENKPGFTREFGDNWKEQFYGFEPKVFRVNRYETDGFYKGGEQAMIDNMLARTIGKNTDKSRSLLTKYEHVRQGLDTGFCLWAGIDHNRGYCTNPAVVGVLDFFRVPKFHYYSAMAQNENVKPFVFINTYLTKKQDIIYITSNCKQIRLYVNDTFFKINEKEKSILPSLPFEFYIGNIEVHSLFAEGISDDGIVCQHKVTKSKEPYKVKILKNDYDLVADGSDKIMIYAQVEDENGNVCYNASNEIVFSILGQGKIISNDRIKANPVKAQSGIAGILIEATEKADEITLKAESKGLNTSCLSFKSIENPRKTVQYIIPKATSEKVVFDDEKQEKQEKKLCNIAMNKKTSATSGIASNGNNGNPNTEWEADLNDHCPEWTLDLGKTYNLEGFRILWSVDSTTYEYKIYVKTDDFGEWQEFSRTSGTGQDISMKNMKIDNIRYIKISVTKVSKDTASFLECEVYSCD